MVFRVSYILFAVLVTTFFFAGVSDLWAQNFNMNYQARQVAGQAANSAKLVAVASYVIGVFFAAKGLIALRNNMLAPDKAPLTHALGLLIVSALLIFLPYTLRVVSNTLGATHMSAGALKSSADAFNEGEASHNGVAGVLRAPATDGFSRAQFRAVKSVEQVPKLVAVFAYIAGVFFAATGLMKLKDWMNDSSRNPLNPAIFRLVTAALLIALPYTLLIMTGSFFGRSGASNTFSVEVNVKTPMGKLSSFKRLN